MSSLLAPSSASFFISEFQINIGMRFFEIKPIKPLTPQQQRIKSLQTQKQNISKQLKAERDRQKIQRAQQTIQSVISKAISNS